MSSQLPLLSCDGCGVCCLYVGVPPFRHDGTPDSIGQAVAALPAELREAVTRELLEGPLRYGGPCSWLDPVTHRCRHYEHRPAGCRQLELGGEDCRYLRELAGLPPGPQ